MNAEDAEPIFLPPHAGTVLDFLGVTHKLTSEPSGGLIYIFESAFEPGTGNWLHVHSREDEIAYVLEVRLRDRTVVLEAGGVSCLPKTVPHALRNPLDTTPRYLFLPFPGDSTMVRCPCRREGRWFTQRDAIPLTFPSRSVPVGSSSSPQPFGIGGRFAIYPNLRVWTTASASGK